MRPVFNIRLRCCFCALLVFADAGVRGNGHGGRFVLHQLFERDWRVFEKKKEKKKGGTGC